MLEIINNIKYFHWIFSSDKNEEKIIGINIFRNHRTISSYLEMKQNF